ncbi:MAG: hypothetical protein ILO53_05555 [Clostridia bacterium]|nr:hypothetical protein [Clostridia bacterium]
MKRQSALSNLFYVIILLALAGFLVVEFGVVKLAASTQKTVATLLLAVAIIMVAAVEFLFPILANKVMLKNNRYRLMIVIKAVLFVAAALVLFLYEPFHVIKSMPVALALFVVFYFIQFFISLDPKVETKKKTPARKPAAVPQNNPAAQNGSTTGSSGNAPEKRTARPDDMPGSIDDINPGDSDDDIEDFLFDIETDD